MFRNRWPVVGASIALAAAVSCRNANQQSATMERAPANEMGYPVDPAQPATQESMAEPVAAPPQIPTPDAAPAWAPDGYHVEIAVKDLVYPTSVESDRDGTLYIAEAGFVDGDPASPARVLRVTADGHVSVAVDQLIGPVNDLLWHDGSLYISQRGKISRLMSDGSVLDLVSGLPSFGDHQNNQLAIGPDGKLYFGQGTATNSGVVGVDNFAMGWLKRFPGVRDVPARDIILTKQQWITIDPLAMTSGEPPLVRTGAMSPFGLGAAAGGYIHGSNKANGSILRMDLDGQNLEVYAWGLRNPYGVAWSADGKLFATDDGFDDRGSRPIANAPDAVWRITQDGWYGWPDYAAGDPVTLAQFTPAEGVAPQFLMRDHPPIEPPLAKLAAHAGAAKMTVAPAGSFGFEGELFVAESGDMAPMTGHSAEPKGYDVVRINPASGETQVFFRTRDEALGSAVQNMQHVETSGPKRLVDVQFAPGGEALYIVDLGALAVLPGANPTPQPFPGTGVIWRVVKDGSTGTPGPTNVSTGLPRTASHSTSAPATQPAEPATMPAPDAASVPPSQSVPQPAENSGTPAVPEAPAPEAPQPKIDTPAPPAEQLNK